MSTKKSNKKKKAATASKKTKNNSSGLVRKAILACLSIILPIIFFMLPATSNWLNSRPLQYIKAFDTQKERMDITLRKRERHGTTFMIADYVCNNIPKGSWFLMPPQPYYIDQVYDYKNPSNIRETYHHISLLKVFNFHCQDVNLLTMEMDDSEISKAEYTISLNRKGNIGVVKIDSPQRLEMVKKSFTYDVEHVTNAKGVLKILTEMQSK